MVSFSFYSFVLYFFEWLDYFNVNNTIKNIFRISLMLIFPPVYLLLTHLNSFTFFLIKEAGCEFMVRFLIRWHYPGSQRLPEFMSALKGCETLLTVFQKLIGLCLKEKPSDHRLWPGLQLKMLQKPRRTQHRLDEVR